MNPRKIHHSPVEQWISGVVLLTLLLIAGSIIVLHEHHRRQLPLESASPLSGQVMPGSGEEDPSLVEILAGMPDVKRMGSPERFSGENLADKINGKAELYLSAGFRGLITQRFLFGDEPNLWFELFHYEMGSGANAFAVYSTQRREDSRPVDGVSQGYVTANALFMTLGAGYFELIGSRADPDLVAAMEKTAQALTGYFGQSPPQAVQRPESLFPAHQMVPESLALLAADVFGFNGLDQVYTARYQISDEDLTAYISSRSEASQALELSTAYQKFLLDFGGRELDLEGLPKGCRAIDILDLYELICTRGAIFYGVHEAPGPEAARDLIQTMTRHMIEAAHGS